MELALLFVLVEGFAQMVGQFLRLKLEHYLVKQRELVGAHLLDLAVKDRLKLFGFDILDLRRFHAGKVVQQFSLWSCQRPPGALTRFPDLVHNENCWCPPAAT